MSILCLSQAPSFGALDAPCEEQSRLRCTRVSGPRPRQAVASNQKAPLSFGFCHSTLCSTSLNSQSSWVLYSGRLFSFGAPSAFCGGRVHPLCTQAFRTAPLQAAAWDLWHRQLNYCFKGPCSISLKSRNKWALCFDQTQFSAALGASYAKPTHPRCILISEIQLLLIAFSIPLFRRTSYYCKGPCSFSIKLRNK